MPIIDTLYTYKFIKLLSTAWVDTDAFKLGIVDENGEPLKRVHALKGTAEKKAYSSFHRLVFKIKRMLEKIPGGKSATVRYAAAIYLIREEAEDMSIPFNTLQEALKKYFDEEPTNVTGGVDNPEIPLSDKKVIKRNPEDDEETTDEEYEAEIEDDYDDDDYYDDEEEYDDDEDDWEYDPEYDGPEEEWEELSDEDYEEYLNQQESISYQVVNGVLIRTINEGRRMTVRIRRGKRVRRMETKRRGFTRTGKRKMRGAKLSRKRRSLKKAVRKSHRSGAMRRRHRSMVKRRRFH